MIWLQLCKTASGPTHPGRPQDEEPHVKVTFKEKREIAEYICRVDQDQLGIMEEEFDDLKSLFQVCIFMKIIDILIFKMCSDV